MAEVCDSLAVVRVSVVVVWSSFAIVFVACCYSRTALLSPAFFCTARLSSRGIMVMMSSLCAADGRLVAKRDAMIVSIVFMLIW